MACRSVDIAAGVGLRPGLCEVGVMKTGGDSTHRPGILAALLGAALTLAPGLAHANVVATPGMIAGMGVLASLFTAILSIALELPVLQIAARRLGVLQASLGELAGRLVAANLVSQLVLWALLIALPSIAFPALNALLGYDGSRPMLAGSPHPPFVYLALSRTQAAQAIYFVAAWVIIVLVAEAAVVAVEYGFLRRAPKVTARQALALVSVANAFSFGVGSIFMPWWDVVP